MAKEEKFKLEELTVNNTGGSVVFRLNEGGGVSTAYVLPMKEAIELQDIILQKLKSK